MEYDTQVFHIVGQTVFPVMAESTGIKSCAVSYLIQERPDGQWAQCIRFDNPHKLNITEGLIRSRATDHWEKVIDGKFPDAV